MNPIDLVAADFIGNPRINFLKGTASYSNEKLHVKINIGEYDFDKEDMTEEPIPEGEFPVVGLRPEQVYIHTEAVESSIPGQYTRGSPRAAKHW